MRELPNWIILLILLLMGLVFILLVMFGVPQKAVEKLKIIIKVVWGAVS
jgi:hypothetical protein